MQSGPRPFWSHNGAVATPNALASAAALRILSQGGNAVEAAIAAASTIAVVYPHMNGMGGDNVWLIHDGAHQKTRALLGIGSAGRQVSIENYREHGIVSQLPERGVLAANTPPGAVDGWWEAYQYSCQTLGGQREWPDLLADAIRYAEEGYPVTASQVMWSSVLPTVARQTSAAGLLETYLTPSGQIPLVGQRQRMPQLAETLRVTAKEGREGFYRGRVADSIIGEIQAAGGLLECEDWEKPHATWDTPLSLPYRSKYQLVNTPPPTQGFTSLMIMGMLDYFPLDTWGPGSAQYLHVMIDSAKLALAVRNREIGDPAFMKTNARDLLSEPPLRALAQRIDPDGTAVAVNSGPAMDGGTVAIMVMDQQGNAVSLIQSIYHDFGSGFIAQKSGVLLQNRGTSFSLVPGQPNSLLPGKRPAHTLSAAMALRNGRPILVYGTMGGDGQPQTQSAILTRVLDYQMDVTAALDAPRWLYGRTWGTQQEAVFLEERFSREVLEELRRREHDVTVVSAYDDKLGHAQAIAVNPTTRAFAAATDPRSDGGACGW